MIAARAPAALAAPTAGRAARAVLAVRRAPIRNRDVRAAAVPGESAVFFSRVGGIGDRRFCGRRLAQRTTAGAAGACGRPVNKTDLRRCTVVRPHPLAVCGRRRGAGHDRRGRLRPTSEEDRRPPLHLGSL